MFSFFMASLMCSIALSVTVIPLGASAVGVSCLCPVSMTPRLLGLLLLPVADGCADRVFGENRAVNLDGRKRKLLHDVSVLDRERFIDGLALDPLGCERRRGNGGATAEGLELG